jgi:translocator protein
MYPATSPRSLLRLALAIALVMLVSYLGGAVTQGALTDWYRLLPKPWFTPPPLAFPIAWTLLFALMAVAFWRVLRYPVDHPGRSAAVLAFLVQITLNCAWSFIFFGSRSPGAGLVVILALFFAILTTIVLFRRVDGAAALMLVPYLVWVGFATAVNASVVGLTYGAF